MNRLAMPAYRGCTVMILSGTFRALQEGRKSCLSNLGVVAPYYWGKTGKGSKGRTPHAHVLGHDDGPSECGAVLLGVFNWDLARPQMP
jgi:hypothetical protein